MSLDRTYYYRIRGDKRRKKTRVTTEELWDPRRERPPSRDQFIATLPMWYANTWDWEDNGFMPGLIVHRWEDHWYYRIPRESKLIGGVTKRLMRMYSEPSNAEVRIWIDAPWRMANNVGRFKGTWAEWADHHGFNWRRTLSRKKGCVSRGY